MVTSSRRLMCGLPQFLLALRRRCEEAPNISHRAATSGTHSLRRLWRHAGPSVFDLPQVAEHLPAIEADPPFFVFQLTHNTCSTKGRHRTPRMTGEREDLTQKARPQRVRSIRLLDGGHHGAKARKPQPQLQTRRQPAASRRLTFRRHTFAAAATAFGPARLTTTSLCTGIHASTKAIARRPYTASRSPGATGAWTRRRAGGNFLSAR